MHLFDSLFPPPPPKPVLEPQPTFPLHTLPPVIRSYVTTSASALRVVPELVAAPLLAFAGSTIGSRLRIDTGNGWLERPVIWIALVALTGGGKSPAIAAARRPLDILQQEAFAAWQQQHDAWNRQDDEPVPDRLFVTGSTIDTLIDDLRHSHGLAIVRDELYGLVRANQRRGGDERQKYLSLWSSEPVVASRKGTNTLWLPHPVVSIVGGIQPMLVHKMRSREQDGFVERFLPVFVRIQPRYWHESTVTQSTSSSLDNVVNLFRQLRTLPNSTDPAGTILHRTPGAASAWATWFNDNVDRLREAPLHVQGYYSKLPGHVARLALILHTTWHPENPFQPISDSTMHHAIELGEFFRTHIHRTLLMLGEFDPIPPPKPTLAQRIHRTLLETTASDGWLGSTRLQLALGKPGKTAFDSAIQELVNASRIELRQVQSSSRGRPTIQYRATRTP